MGDDTKVLYRPVGVREAELILDAGSRAFPPRLPGQPFFYPVLTYEYAEQIARDWNIHDAASGFAGFVTRFQVDAAYLQQFEVQQVGAGTHKELWIPAEDLPTFNQHIQGRIEIVDAFYGVGYQGSKHFFQEWYAEEIFVRWHTSFQYGAGQDLLGEMVLNRNAIALNFKYWRTHPVAEVSWNEQQEFLDHLAELWPMKFPDITLMR